MPLIQDKESFKKEYLEIFSRVESNPLESANNWEKYHALVTLVKEMMNTFWVNTVKSNIEKDKRRVYYLSMEFLIGKMLSYNLMNLGIENIVREGLADLNISYDELLLQEKEAPLGNGGLGRLAACYLDSMAHEKEAGYGFGFGIRYKYGLFNQKIVDGYQVEVPDPWLRDGYVWETIKPDRMVMVKFKGHVRTEMVGNRLVFIHENYEPVLAVPYDMLFLGYMDTARINYLRLYSAEPMMQDFDLQSFNQGEFVKAAAYRAEVEAISSILYPEDQNVAGKELRLKQEYFLSAASVGDCIFYYKMIYGSLDKFAQRVAFHINDTHPAVSIPELMRILIDDEGMGWEEAWEITVHVFSYTNHTILPEALERWPVEQFRALLPRIFMIIEEIDRRFRMEINSRFPGDEELLRQTAIIADGEINMAHLSVVGSYSINGVSQIHSKILKENILGSFYKITPEKFHNITNGVSHRRFLHLANPPLSDLISQTIGREWIYQANELEKLLPYNNDLGFLEQLAEAKYKNKERLAKYIFQQQRIAIDPASIFDVHVKRLHGYKRQFLNVLKIMDLYNALKEEGKTIQPTTFVFGGKASSGYKQAKDIIKLINSVAQIVNNDSQVSDYMRIIFLENFNVSLGEIVYPAADISEQISTASKEASGTGCMKFMFNGAITLGSYDGANLEIHEAVGDEHIVLFGLTAEQVMDLYADDRYKAWDEYLGTPRLKRVVDQLVNGFFKTSYDFHSLYESLLRENDQFFVLRDFCPYIHAWDGLNQKYADQEKWLQSVLHNIAKAGIFSSDRAIKEYNELIWNRK